MSLIHNSSIVTNGLVYCSDPANPRSYVGSGTNLFDVTGNNSTGTLTNGPTYTSGINGYFTYDGVDDFVTIPNTTALQVADTFSLNVWIYSTDLSQRDGVFSTRIVNTAGCWQLEVGTASGGQGRVAVTGVGTWIWESSNDVITTNAWYNICFVKPNNATQGGSMYLNGTLLTPLTTTAYTIANNSDNKVIGQGTNGSQLFSGRISQILLYSTALSADQVLQNYNAIRGRYGI